MILTKLEGPIYKAGSFFVCASGPRTAKIFDLRSQEHIAFGLRSVEAIGVPTLRVSQWLDFLGGLLPRQFPAFFLDNIWKYEKPKPTYLEF